jgi:BUD22
MPKRKHSELENDASKADARVNQVKATRLHHKFERGAQLVFRALKTARGFERQKLGRRQKTAKQDGDSKASERLEKEVQILKVHKIHGKKSMCVCVWLLNAQLQALALEETAERYLHKQLIKTKRISELPEFVQLEKSLTSVTSTAGPRDPAEANVTARLFKSNPVQNALPDILTDIRTLLGVNEVAKKQQKQNTEEPKAAKKPDVQKERRQSVTPDSVENNNAEHLDNDVNMNDVSDDDDESFDFAQFDSRLAPTSDVSGSESEEEEDDPTSTKPKYNLADDISISSAASEEDGYISDPLPPPKSELKGRTKKGNDEPPKDTTFLPSLMMGGYWSGSESGDDDETATAAAGKPQRKNRMGQQARRALWEKKFGTKANHIQQQQQKQGKNKNSGWDMRRGATDANDNNNKPKWAQNRDGQSQSFARRNNDRDSDDRRGENQAAGAAPRSNKATALSGTLHPSWEAARKAKEQKSKASFEGKKIVFD